MMLRPVVSISLRFGLAGLAILFSAGAQGATEVERFAPFEVAFSAADIPANPYTALSAEAVLLGPDGAERRIPLYWDGAAVWKLRFAPGAVGEWTYYVRSADSSLNAEAGAFTCIVSQRQGGIEPMAGHGTHFQYEDGTPCWFLGDTAWALCTDSKEEGHDWAGLRRYVDARAAQGFTALHAMLLSEAGWGNAGGPPFDDIGNQTLNPGYWREIDRRVAYANSKGITVGLALAWGEKSGKERYPWHRFPNAEARKRYAAYIAARYSAYNVYFLVSGEWHGEVRNRRDMSADAVAREFIEIGDVLAASDPHGRMIAIHPMTRQGTVREFNVADWMSFGDYQQNYTDLHGRILLSAGIGKPVVNSEYGYLLRDSNGDGQPDKDNSFSTADMRHASWDIVTAGGYLVTGFGTTYFGGNRDPGPFNLDDPRNDEWEAQIGYMKDLFESLPWWKLIPADALVMSDAPRSPDTQQPYVNGGRKTVATLPPKRTYWAMCVPGEIYVVYVRGMEKPVRLELDSREGNFIKRWYNPRNGRFERGEEVAISGAYEITPPDAEDWVLVLQRYAPGN